MKKSSLQEKPIEWLAVFVAIVAIDIYYHKSQKRPTLSAVVKGSFHDPIVKSLAWAGWTWLSYHWFFEG